MRNLIDDPHLEFTASMMAHDKRRSWLEANIAACRRLLASCGDEDAMAAMSLAGQIDDWEGQLTEILSGTASKPPAEPAGGYIGGKATQVHAGSAEGVQRASGNVRPYLEGATVTFVNGGKMRAVVGIEHVMTASERIVAQIYEDAARAMGPDPIPLAGTEPWVENDAAYRGRLADLLGYPVVYSGEMLDDYGLDAAELPRARLVPTQQEPRP